MTQPALCAASGILPRQLTRYESGEQEPTFTKIIALADALNVSLDYLAGRTDKPEINR